MVVEYAATPNGKPALDSRGQLIPAWGWLVTGHAGALVFYRWNATGQVFKWSEGKMSWEFLATCTPQSPGALSTIIPPPKCSPELH